MSAGVIYIVSPQGWELRRRLSAKTADRDTHTCLRTGMRGCIHTNIHTARNKRSAAQQKWNMRAEDSGGNSTCASGTHPRTNCGTRQNRTVEHFVDVSILQIQEGTSELASFGMHSTACSCDPFPSVFFFQCALLGSSSSSHPQACNAVGTSVGVIPLSRNSVH